MAGEQQIKKAAEKVGADIGAEMGKQFQKISEDMIARQFLPKNALGMSDQMIEGIYGQAYRLYNTGKYKDAAELFRLLVMLNSTEPKYSMGLAACFHMMKDYKSAVSTYAICGVIDPESPIPHYHSSDCFLQMRDPVSALISLEMAVKRAGEKQEYQSLKDRALMTIQSLKKETEAKKKKKEAR